MKHGSTAIKIEAVVEVECDFAYCVNGTIEHDFIRSVHKSGDECPICNGTGKVERMLTGTIKFEHIPSDEWLGTHFVIRDFNKQGDFKFLYLNEALTDLIVKFYKSNSLSDSLMQSDDNPDGLKLIDIKDKRG